MSLEASDIAFVSMGFAFVLMASGGWFRSLRLYHGFAISQGLRMLACSLLNRDYVVVKFLCFHVAWAAAFYLLTDSLSTSLVTVYFISILVWAALILSTPPAALLRGASTEQSVNLLGSLAFGARPYRVVSLLDLQRSSLPKRLFLGFVNKRLLGGYDWQRVVTNLIDHTPVIVIDTRVSSEAVKIEFCELFKTVQRLRKTIFVVENDGTCPVLREIHAENRSPPMERDYPAEACCFTSAEEAVDAVKEYLACAEKATTPLQFDARDVRSCHPPDGVIQ